MRNKRGMQLAMNTVVIIALTVMVLILGGYFVQKIFTTGKDTINQIDSAVKNEVSKLFTQDESRKIVIYPNSRRFTLDKGEQGEGFAFSIRNIGIEADTFTYVIEAQEVTCPSSLSLSQANSFIALGRTGTIQISAGSIMENPRLVTFNIPETAPPCEIKYSLTMEKGGELYGTSVDFDVAIASG